MSSPSRKRRQLAVNTAREYANGKDVSGTIKTFDERQLRIYHNYIPQFQSMCNFYDSIDRDIAGVIKCAS